MARCAERVGISEDAHFQKTCTCTELWKLAFGSKKISFRCRNLLYISPLNGSGIQKTPTSDADVTPENHDFVGKQKRSTLEICRIFEKQTKTSTESTEYFLSIPTQNKKLKITTKSPTRIQKSPFFPLKHQISSSSASPGSVNLGPPQFTLLGQVDLQTSYLFLP